MTTFPRYLIPAALAALLLTIAPRSRADDTPAPDKPADNSGQNVRDRQNDATTPMQQGESDADISTTKRIRQAVIADKSLSVNAHNVKIITRDGRVTLRGPVNSDLEKKTIMDIASNVVDASVIDNQIDVKAPSSN
jgi:hyperosmotically inducible periplasmic protein